jgi:hypothetical protein
MNIINILDIIKFMISENINAENDFIITYNKETNDLNVVFLKPQPEKYYKQIVCIVRNDKEIPVYSSVEDNQDRIFNLYTYIDREVELCIDSATEMTEDYVKIITYNKLLNEIKDNFELSESEYQYILEQTKKDELSDITLYGEDDEDDEIENLIFYFSTKLVKLSSVKQSFFNIIDSYAEDILQTINDNLRKLTNEVVYD